MSNNKCVSDVEPTIVLPVEKEFDDLIFSLNHEKRSLMYKARELATERKRFEDEKAAMMKFGTKDDDVIDLNVGGKHFTTRRSTLCLPKDSMLAAMFSGRWEDAHNKDAKGRIVLDFDPEAFAFLLKLLRDHACNPPRYTLKRPPLASPHRPLWDFLNVVPLPVLCDKSAILVDDAHRSALKGMLEKAFGEEDIETDLLYVANGDVVPTDFHVKCDNKGATVTLIKSAEGWIFGGFNIDPWTSDGNGNYNNKSFLFTVTNPASTAPTAYLVNSRTSPDSWPRYTTQNRSNCGPLFGALDYCGTDIGCNINGGGTNYVNFPCNYVDTTGRGSSTFTGSNSFTIARIEVWSVPHVAEA